MCVACAHRAWNSAVSSWAVTLPSRARIASRARLRTCGFASCVHMRMYSRRELGRHRVCLARSISIFSRASAPCMRLLLGSHVPSPLAHLTRYSHVPMLVAVRRAASRADHTAMTSCLLVGRSVCGSTRRHRHRSSKPPSCVCIDVTTRTHSV